MDSSSIELPGSVVESVRLADGVLRIHFSRAYIVKTLTGSMERTRWWQAGDLVLEGATLEGDVPAGPLVCAGGDVGENIYTYRDMIPVPLNSRGQCHCDLRFVGIRERFIASGRGIHLDMAGVAKYIEHIRPTAR